MKSLKIRENLYGEYNRYAIAGYRNLGGLYKKIGKISQNRRILYEIIRNIM